MSYYMVISLNMSWNRTKVKVKSCINIKDSVQIHMETKETCLFLCPRGSWLRERPKQITKNITVECQITDISRG